MAMETASPSRNLWQLPVFLLGIAALVGVWYGRPYWRSTPSQEFERNLAALRLALDKVPVDAGQVQTLLHKVQGIDPKGINAPPNVENQVPYVIGSALVVVAETTQTPDEAEEQWKNARHLLEIAEENGLPDADKTRQQYRLAKTWAHTAEPVSKTIDALVKSLNCGDDASEGNRLLSELYLRLIPPDSKKAKECLKEYLGHVIPSRGENQQRQMNECRLLLGRLHAQAGETEDARKVLEKIGPDASPEMLAEARIQLGKSYALEEDWRQAIRCLEQARDVRGGAAAQRSAALYQLAEYYARDNRQSDSVAALDQVRKNGGPEGQAAALKLGQIQLHLPKKSEDAAHTFENALNGVKNAADYQNKLMPLADARAIFEEAIPHLRKAKLFELSIRVARAYSHIAEKGRDREMAAESLETWGLSLLEEVKKADATERPRLADEGVKRIREAANEWRQAAALKTTSLEKGDALCRAADLFLKADDKEESLKTFDLLGLHVPDYPDERLAEVWLKKGDIYLSLGNREQARICFQNGIQIAEKSRSPILLKLRMRLTEILLRSSDPKIAARAIDDLMILLDDPELVKDQELHETALLFIANAVYQQKDYRRAEVRFRSLIDRYPESPRTISARYYLGQCYWFIAGQEADKCNSSKKVSDDPATTDDRRQEAEAAYKISYSQYQEFLNKALEPIKAAETQLLQMLANAKLSAADAELLRKSSLAAADICFFTGKYEEAASRYDAISKRYAQTVVQLEALRSKLRCLRIYLNKPTEASEILTQMSLILQKVPESEFDGSTPVHFREYWLKWLEEQRQMKM